MKIKIGMGYDSHRLIKNNDTNSTVPIFGIKIKAQYAVDAHSDGDVGLHSLIDAILGACGLGDIGEHYPVSDNNLKGIDSNILLSQAVEKMLLIGGSIINIDTIIISQYIKISNIKKDMILNISNLTKVKCNDINIKAKTAEYMGALGRGEGIAAYSTILIMFKDQ